MKRFVFIIVLIHIAIISFAQDSNIQDLDMSEGELISGLSNVDPEIREQCAIKIENLLNKGLNVIQEGNIVEYPPEYWFEKFNRYKPSMKKEHFEEVFFKREIDYDPNFSNVKFYKLDHFHTLRVEVYKKKVKLKELAISLEFFPVDPGDHYTGVWKTYYISGSVHSATEYLNGIKNGTAIIYSMHGDISWVKNYDNGEVTKLYRSKEGKMVEEDLDILDVEGEGK